MGTSSKQRKSSAADSGGATEMTDDMMGSDSALNASTPLQTSAGGSQGGSAGGVPGEGSAQVPSGITHYPVAHVTHQQLCANSQLFFKTLLSLLNTLGLTLKVKTHDDSRLAPSLHAARFASSASCSCSTFAHTSAHA